MTDDEAEEIIREFNGGIDDDKVFVTELRRLGLTTTHIAGILRVVDEVCHSCWDTMGQCYCMRDD